jgi:hypothetical protein
MKRRAIYLLTAVAVAVLLSTSVGLAESPSGSQQTSTAKGSSVTVMTRNVYHGVDAELGRVATASSFPAFLDATAAVYNGYHERNFPQRAAGLAAEIEETQPDVVGLQEAVMVRTDTPADGSATPAEEMSLDYLQILLDKLQARGLDYTPVVQSINWDIEVPTSLGFDLRHTDRIVTLIRTDGPSGIKVLDLAHEDLLCHL